MASADAARIRYKHGHGENGAPQKSGHAAAEVSKNKLHVGIAFHHAAGDQAGERDAEIALSPG